MSTPQSALAHDRREIRAISVSAWFDPFVSVAIIIAAYLFLYKTTISNIHLTLLITLFTACYFFFSELTRAKWKFSERPQQNTLDILARTLTKFLGVLAGICAILFAIWLFPEYHTTTRLDAVRAVIVPFLAFVLPASFILIFATEYILGPKKDGTYQFGLLAQLRLQEMDWNIFLDGVLEWLVRCIFLLINFFSAMFLITRLRANGLPDFSGGFVDTITRLDTAIFTLIIFAILPGYVFASRLIGTEIKKIDRTWFGWAITLSSYSPLSAAVFGAWMRSAPMPEAAAVFAGIPAWGYITAEQPIFLYTLGALIILFGLFHLWSEAQMGIRSANLSIRGIITTGAFSITKHPVYVSKCFQWVCVYLPILNAFGFLNAIQSGLLFLMVCAMFAGRALAEEKLLAQDANYVKYALYMDEKSVFAFIGRIVPVMSFRWRYEFWKRNGYLPYSAEIA